MSNDFYQSEAFKELMNAIQEKYGHIKSYTVCHSFESPENLERLAMVEEEGEEECPEDEQLEVEYPEDEEIDPEYLPAIPTYEAYYDPWYSEYADEYEDFEL
jgi:hypothetical protein